MGDNDDSSSHNVVIVLIAMGSAAFVVSMYHVIAICLCNQRRQQQQPQTEGTSWVSVAHMIPTHTYRKKKVDRAVQDRSNSNGGDDEGGETCAVCLGDFEEGEELRSLPECMHSFHLSCIDTWLSSHSSCPICRSSATPSLEMLHSDHDLNNAYQYQHNIDMTQFHNLFVTRR